MSVGRKLSRASEKGMDASGGKKPRIDRGVSGVELHIDPGLLVELDQEKVKSEIMRWAKAVVAFARQLSFHGRRHDDVEA